MKIVWWNAKTRYLRSPSFSKERIMSEGPIKVISNDYLLEDLQILLDSLNEQIKHMEKEAEILGVPPTEMRLHTGEYPMHTLLTAKAHCYSAMALMKSIDGLGTTIVNNYTSNHSYGADGAS